MADPLTLLESVDLLGRYRYIELGLGDALEQNGREGESPAVRVCASILSRAHAWRARLFEELLPVSVGLPSVEDCIRAPSRVTEEIFASLDELDREGMLVVLRDLWYPAMLLSYEHHVGIASAVCDGPIVLNVIRAIRDLQFAGEQLSRAVVDRPRFTGASFERLEALLEKSGGPFGHVRTAEELNVE